MNMNTGISLKKLKRCFRKKLYLFLTALNNADFSKLRPFCFLLFIGAITAFLSSLPTSETTNILSEQVALGTELSTAIRTDISTESNSPVHIVALFLPNELSKERTIEVLHSETLYSFYLTGTELRHLAEGAVTNTTEENYLHLDGINFTYHKNRLPFNRVTEISATSGEEISDNLLYHVVSTEDIFALFHYISYRSLDIMQVHPKNAAGSLLSDYQEVIVTEANVPLTIGTVLSSISTYQRESTETPSIVTTQSGFNLIDLVKNPNQITLCAGGLFLAFVILLWYILPRLNRIRLWIRIYRIRSRKRSTHTLHYGLKKRF